eukprot:1239575-Pyramimonas_sp.AAC.1
MDRGGNDARVPSGRFPNLTMRVDCTKPSQEPSSLSKMRRPAFSEGHPPREGPLLHATAAL